MKSTIYVLKRSNGFYGIYVNGTRQENLESNQPLSDKSNYMFDNIMRTCNKYKDYKLIFTEDEEIFKSDLPSLQEYLQGLNINS